MTRANAARHKAAKLRATPVWVDHSRINEMYEAAVFLSKKTGKIYHVDHIVPLQSKIVCGLHVPWNLKLLTAEENQRKGNKVSQ